MKILDPAVVRFTVEPSGDQDGVAEAVANLAVWTLEEDRGIRCESSLLRIESETRGPYFKLVVRATDRTFVVGLEGNLRRTMGELGTKTVGEVREEFERKREAGREAIPSEPGLEVLDDWQPPLLGIWDTRGFRT